MLLARMLDRIVHTGRLTLIDASGRTRTFGKNHGPNVAMRLADRGTARRLALKPKLAFGESYMDGTLKVENGTIYDLLDLLAINIQRYENMPLARAFDRAGMLLRHRQQANGVGILALIAFAIAPDVPRLFGGRGRPMHNVLHQPLAAGVAVATAGAATLAGLPVAFWLVGALVWLGHLIVGWGVGDVPRAASVPGSAPGLRGAGEPVDA